MHIALLGYGAPMALSSDGACNTSAHDGEDACASTPPRAGVRANAAETAAYISDLLEELQAMAKYQGLDTLNLMLAMAREQAGDDASAAG